MRQTISGLVAAIAVVTASAAPAMACGLFGPCSPCAAGYVGPCAQTYVPAYTYYDRYERLADPVQQYHAAAPVQPSTTTSTRARPLPVPAPSRLIRPIRKPLYPAGAPTATAAAITGCAATTDRRI